ncbi:histone H1.5-like [Rhinoraja longicauda]
MAENHEMEDVGNSGGGGVGVGGGSGGVDKATVDGKKRQRAPQRRKRRGSPTVTERVLSVAAATKRRRGISLAALKKTLSARGYNVSRNNTRVNRTVRQLVKKGSLVQTSGTGAQGSFRFNRSKSGQATSPDAGKGSSKEEAAKKQSAAKLTPAPSANSGRIKSRQAGKHKGAVKRRRVLQSHRRPQRLVGRSKPQARSRHPKTKSTKAKISNVTRGSKTSKKSRQGRPPANVPKRPADVKVL